MKVNQAKIKKILSHPNTLTLFRVFVVPGIVLLLLFPNRLTTVLAAFLFTAAAITDFFDGYLARQWDMVSNFGKIMDPLADKLLIASTFIMLSGLGWAPSWVACIIIGREIAITGLRNFAVNDKEDMSASSLAKYKTGFQIAASIPLLIHYPYFNIDFHAVGTLFLYGALVLTVWSGVDYYFRFRKLFGD